MNETIYYLWLDIETSGLEPDVDQMFEVAWGFTDSRLNDVGDLNHEFVERPNFTLAIRDPHVLTMHTRNGLLLDWASSARRSPREVGQLILEQIRELEPATIQLAGSGVHFDQQWLKVWMPELHDRLHYRIGVDVSQLERFLGDVCQLDLPPRPEPEHRAASDVIGSLDYARDLQALIDYLAGAAVEEDDDE